MARKQKQYHFIYKTTNLISGKYYYGMHSTSNLNDGYLGSGKRLRYSINKYGEENHKRDILEFCKDREQLKQREFEIVTLNEIAKIDCMNIKVGGQGGWLVEEQRENAIRSNLAQKRKRESDPLWWDNVLQKRKAAVSTAEYKEERSKFWTEFYKTHHGSFAGKKHKEESKKKIGEAMSIIQKGKGNSQYGTCWILKLKENKKIKVDEIDTWLELNWIKGRKLQF